MTKKCTRCSQEKRISEFSRDKSTKDGLNYYCRKCSSAIGLAWQAKNSEKVRAAHAAWYIVHRNEILAKRATYRANNREQIRIYSAAYQAAHRTAEAAYDRHRLQTNLQYRLAHALRKRLFKAVRSQLSGGEPGKRGGSAVRDMGCSIVEFKNYIESKFQPGMSWDNWGPKGWHIDHIVPLSKFDLTNREQFLKACHYTNLQPLWARDNLSKGAQPTRY